MLSKVTGFYPKNCLSIGLRNLHMFLRTNLSALRSKLGPFSKSSNQWLSGQGRAFIAGISNIYVSGQKCKKTIFQWIKQSPICVCSPHIQDPCWCQEAEEPVFMCSVWMQATHFLEKPISENNMSRVQQNSRPWFKTLLNLCFKGLNTDIYFSM